jgi:hypothetical protein
LRRKIRGEGDAVAVALEGGGVVEERYPVVVGGGAADQAREVAEYLLTQTLART